MTRFFAQAAKKPVKYKYRAVLGLGFIYFFLLHSSNLALASTQETSTPSRTAKNAQYWIEKAIDRNLADKKGWQRLLFYTNRSFLPNNGIIDEPSFYLSPDGKTNPLAELTATIEAMFTPAQGDATDEHALCRFPGRSLWLKSALGAQTAQWPAISCPKLDAWRTDHIYDRVSIVFSSFYPNNPASMFGHTFLRLHKTNSGSHGSELLDDIVNFAAFPTTDNAFLYGIYGITGQFPGKFSLLPYFLKIQEYNNLESRDLWEYELESTPAQIEKILLSLWEVGPSYADYFYFDENCSFLILALLETGDESWDLMSKLPLWVSPTKSLKIITDEIGVRSSKFRPSALKRYNERFDELSVSEVQAFSQIIKSKHVGFNQLDIGNYEPLETAKIIDAALEYIDYDEKLGGSIQSKKFASFRNDLLLARSKLRVERQVSYSTPAEQNPLLSRPESWLMLSGAGRNSENFAQLTYQPVLQDILSSSRGLTDGMQIQLLTMGVELPLSNRQSPQLSRLDLINIASINPIKRLMTPKSWTLNLGWQRQWPCFLDSGEQASCSKSSFSGSRGFSFHLDLGYRNRLYISTLIRGQIASLSRPESEILGNMGPELHVLFYLGDALRLEGRWHEALGVLKARQERHSNYSISLSASLASYTELRASYDLQLRQTLATPVKTARMQSINAGFLRYF